MKEIREDFCGMCMAVPIALAGAGVAGASTKKQYEKRKSIMIWTGVIVLLMSIFMMWYYKDCKSCKISR
jgi:hypothetical protein